MKLSLRFFYTKLVQEYPEATLLTQPGKNPMLSSLGIITESMEDFEEIVYIDLLKRPEDSLPEQASVITTRKRAERFKRCNVIALPDRVDLAQVMQRVSTEFTRYFGWADKLYEAIAKNTDLQTIIDLTVPIFQNPIYISDSSFKMLASWGGDFGAINPTWRYQEKYHYLPYQVMQSLVETGELKKLYHTPQAWKVSNSKGFTALPYISKAIRKEGNHYGNFYIIELYDHLDACDLELADYLGKVLSTALYGNLNYLETSTLYHAHFLEDIIEGTLTDRRIMDDQLKALHWELDGDYLLALFDTQGDNDAIRHHMMAFITVDLDTQCFSYQGNVLVILNNCIKRMDRITKRLLQISRDFSRLVAISEQFSDFSQLGKFYAQAQFALENRALMPHNAHLLFYEELFFDHLTDHIDDEMPLFSPAVRLQRHDKECGTDYCTTLLTWLAHERNSVKAAQELYVHRNTLKNRLGNIQDIIGVDLDRVETRTRMVLSLYSLKKNEQTQEADAFYSE